MLGYHMLELVKFSFFSSHPNFNPRFSLTSLCANPIRRAVSSSIPWQLVIKFVRMCAPNI